MTLMFKFFEFVFLSFLNKIKFQKKYNISKLLKSCNWLPKLGIKKQIISCYKFHFSLNQFFSNLSIKMFKIQKINQISISIF